MDPHTTPPLSDAEFDVRLEAKLSGLKASYFLTLPGFYEIASEHFNNEIIEDWELDNIPD